MKSLLSLPILLAALLLFSCGKSNPPQPQEQLPPGVAKTHSGLKSKILRPGKGGRTPNSLSTVKVHYKGWTKEGNVFDTSYQRGIPAEFPLAAVIPGWTEGVQLMTKGEKRRFWIPARLAYGNQPSGGRPAGDLTFDIELIDFR
ncbi:MAG: FKBP-type peptidyl-prolyl cis-trans isomerase [Akkermansiaceae bacterium]